MAIKFIWLQQNTTLEKKKKQNFNSVLYFPCQEETEVTIIKLSEKLPNGQQQERRLWTCLNVFGRGWTCVWKNEVKPEVVVLSFSLKFSSSNERFLNETSCVCVVVVLIIIQNNKTQGKRNILFTNELEPSWPWMKISFSR